MWGNFSVIRQQRFVPSSSQSLQSNGRSQDRTLGNNPSTHSGTAPLASMFRINPQPDQVLPFPFSPLQPGPFAKNVHRTFSLRSAPFTAWVTPNQLQLRILPGVTPVHKWYKIKDFVKIATISQIDRISQARTNIDTEKKEITTALTACHYWTRSNKQNLLALYTKMIYF